jgi:hypothetical protein
MKNLSAGTSILLAAALLAGCSVSVAPDQTAVPPPEMQTAAALTVQAILSATPLPSPEEQTSVPLGSAVPPGGTSTPVIVTATTTASTGTATASQQAPKLTVEDVTNCRSGPGLNYERVAQVVAGQQVSILGSFPGYWLVQVDSGLCWVAMEFSTPSGNIAGVPTVTQPATPLAGEPDAPGLQEWTYACTGGEAEVTIQWSDRANDETGYRVYLDGKVLAELAANSTQYSTRIPIQVGHTNSIYVEAFNEAGAASFAPFAFSC